MKLDVEVFDKAAALVDIYRDIDPYNTTPERLSRLTTEQLEDWDRNDLLGLIVVLGAMCVFKENAS